MNNPCKHRRPSARLLVMVCLLWGTLASASAEPLPLGSVRVPPRQGFGLSVEMESIPGNGYQPLYLQFHPLGRSFLRERNLTVEITPLDELQSELDFTYRCRVQLPQNGSGVRSVQYIPYYYAWERVRVRVLEDGQALKGCDEVLLVTSPRQKPLEHTNIGIVVSSDMDRFLQRNTDIEKQQRNDYRQTQIRLATRPSLPHLVASGGAVQATGVLVNAIVNWTPMPVIEVPPAWQQCPDVRSLRAVFSGALPSDPEIQRLDHAEALKVVQQLQPAEVQFRVLDAQQMPEHWLAHSQLDVVLIAAPLLQQLEARPAAYRALTDWVANGGNLWVYATQQGSCEMFDRIDLQPIAANSVLEGRRLTQSMALDQANDLSVWEYNTYSGPIRGSAMYTQLATASSGTTLSRQQAYDAAKNSEHPFASEVKPPALASLIRQGRFGIGTVTAIDREDPFPQSYQFWNAVVHSVGDDQLNWTGRTGLDVPAGSSHFWSMLIASVGQPPVKTFISLNTLFVLIAGPLCYLYLRRRQRLFLLFFIAPTMALVITGGLIFYAYFADGVRTRTRVRQITWVDARANYVITQSRQTYFAVLSSRKGLWMPDDVGVYPVTRGSIRSGYNYRHSDMQGVEGTITADKDQMHFQGGFLPPRTQVQMLVMRPAAHDQTLQFAVTDQSIAVTNRLPYPIRQLSLRDKAGNVWQSSVIAPAATVNLSRLPVGQPADLGIEKLQPTVTPNLRSTRDPWGRYSMGTQGTLLERSLEDWLSYLPPERFIAVAEDCQLEFLGTEDADMTQASHVLMGKLP